MEEFTVRIQRHVGHSSILIALLEPFADFLDFLRYLKEILGCFLFLVFLELGFFEGAEEVFEVFVKTKFHHRLFHEGFFDSLIMLVVDVLANQIGQFGAFLGTFELSIVERVLVGVQILLFFDHVG